MAAIVNQPASPLKVASAFRGRSESRRSLVSLVGFIIAHDQ